MKALERKRKRSVLGGVQVRRQDMEPQEWAREADPWAVRAQWKRRYDFDRQELGQTHEPCSEKARCWQRGPELPQ